MSASDVDEMLEGADDMADDGLELPEEDGVESSATGGKKSFRGSSGAVPKAAPKGAAKAAAKGKRNKVVNGKKFCPVCKKWLPAEEFPTGSGQCAIDRRFIQNMTAAACAQGKDDWWKEVQAEPAKLESVHKAWLHRCLPKAGSTKCQPFAIAVYLEECRQEEQVLKDGLYEMYNLKHYVHFIGEPPKWVHGSRDCKAEMECSLRCSWSYHRQIGAVEGADG